MVAGYVVMRIAMLAQWLRLAAQSPRYRPVALTYARWIALAQVGWVVLALLPLRLVPTLALAGVLFLVELLGPIRAERVGGTPWHPHHISERYGLLVIIALGEGVLGTIAAVQPIIAEQGWSDDAIVLVTAGILLTFGMWWAYFALPWAELLHANQRASFLYGYLHILIFGAVAAVGAGLHVAAYVVEGTAEVGFGEAVRAVAIPVAVFLVMSLLIVTILARRVDLLNLGLCLTALGVLVVTVILTSSGTPFALDVLLASAAPWVFVLGYELVGRHRMTVHLSALATRNDA